MADINIVIWLKNSYFTFELIVILLLYYRQLTVTCTIHCKKNSSKQINLLNFHYGNILGNKYIQQY